MLISAGRNETFDFATPIGVGLIESAINLTRLCLFDRPESLIFVGSAGSYGNYKPLDIVETNMATNIELSYLENRSYTPIDNVIHSDIVSHETSKKPIAVNSSNYITTDRHLGSLFLKLGIELENMEFYSVLAVAKELEIPAKGIFVVTNYCDNNAHDDFKKNHAPAMSALINHLRRYQYI